MAVSVAEGGEGEGERVGAPVWQLCVPLGECALATRQERRGEDRGEQRKISQNTYIQDKQRSTDTHNNKTKVTRRFSPSTAQEKRKITPCCS